MKQISFSSFLRQQHGKTKSSRSTASKLKRRNGFLPQRRKGGGPFLMSMGMCDILALSFLIFPLLSFRRSDLDPTYYILYMLTLESRRFQVSGFRCWVRCPVLLGLCKYYRSSLYEKCQHFFELQKFQRQLFKNLFKILQVQQLTCLGNVREWNP